MLLIKAFNTKNNYKQICNKIIYAIKECKVNLQSRQDNVDECTRT